MVERLQDEFGPGTERGRAALDRIVEEIKRRGRNLAYDCVVGVSGGVDSSFLVHWAVERGLRPLAAHYDNTWNSAVATQNIRRVLTPLGVDLYTHVVDNRESDDIFRSFFLANAPGVDTPTDIALSEVLYRAAASCGVRYILEGHSFLAEGVSPLGSSYVDGRYIATIHRKFGRRQMRTFPNMEFMAFMKWTILYRIRKIRPFWYLAYSKEDAKRILSERYGWQDYGGHHLENRMSAFNHSVYKPQKCDTDQRNNTLSARVRSGSLSRSEALEAFARPPLVDPHLVDYVIKRLGLTREEFAAAMSTPPAPYSHFKTYKKLFERLRPLFFVLAKANLVPTSFYIKYCSKSES